MELGFLFALARSSECVECLMFRTTRQKVEQFRKGRSRQSDADFLRDLGLPDDPDAARVGLAVRRACAYVGLVDPLFICADDRDEVELSVLPLWDSMDWIALHLELERELGIDIPDREAERIRVRNFTVRQCAHDTLAIVQRLRTS